MPDIDAHAAPPDFTLLECGRMVLGVQLFLLAVPAWEILLHRNCMAQNTGRVQHAVARALLLREMKEKNRGDFV